MDLQTRLRIFREGGQVTRCHTMPHLGHYDNAQHSFNMLLLLFELYPGKPPARLVRAITYHDIMERFTGDAPSASGPDLQDERRTYRGIKHLIQGLQVTWARKFGVAAKLTTREWKWLHSLDYLEYWLWCQDQIMLGNKNVHGHAVKQYCILVHDPSTPRAIRDFMKDFRPERGIQDVEPS